MRINADGLTEIVIGRDSEQKTLSAYIKLGQHCAIIAPRRYGKTTLVNSVLEKLDIENHLIIRLDVMSSSSVRELCTQMVDAVYASHGVANFFKQVRDNVLEILSRLNLDNEFVSIGYDILREPDESEMLNSSITKILSDNEPLFEFEWDRINGKKHKGRVLKELLGIDNGDNTPINSSYKSQMIRELKDESILNDDKSMTDPMFEQWLLNRLSTVL